MGESKKQPDKDYSFPQKCRLKKRSEFEAVFNFRNSAADSDIVVFLMPNGLGYSRLGIVIGRKLGNAVKRNRFKRIVREAFRKLKNSFPANFDILVLPRNPLNTKLKSTDIENSLAMLVEKLYAKLKNSSNSEENATQ